MALDARVARVFLVSDAIGRISPCRFLRVSLDTRVISVLFRVGARVAIKAPTLVSASFAAAGAAGLLPAVVLVLEGEASIPPADAFTPERRLFMLVGLAPPAALIVLVLMGYHRRSVEMTRRAGEGAAHRYEQLPPR